MSAADTVQAPAAAAVSESASRAAYVAPDALKRLHSVAEFRKAAARASLPIFDFGDGGAEDERTLQRNERALTMSPSRPGR